jgi:hypothetical protein
MDVRDGLDTDGKRVRHSGIWFTYSAGVLMLPSGYGIAVMTNSGVALGNEGTSQLGRTASPPCSRAAHRRPARRSGSSSTWSWPASLS